MEPGYGLNIQGIMVRLSAAVKDVSYLQAPSMAVKPTQKFIECTSWGALYQGTKRPRREADRINSLVLKMSGSIPVLFHMLFRRAQR
jgi:hypothetical protein